MPSRFWRASGNALLPSPALANTGAAYTPASEAGNNLWIVPDAAHSFTDAGTTNVSVSGTDTARQVNDQSAAGRNLAQATSGARPIWNSGSGKPYLLHDGVDDVLATAANAAWTDGSGQFWVSMSIDPTAATNQFFVSIYDGSAHELLRAQIAGDNTSGFGVFDSTDTITSPPGGAATTGAATWIITVTATLFSIYHDGALLTSVALTGTRQSATAKFFTGGFQGSSTFFKGKLYGAAAGSGTLSSVANMHTYMAALHP